MKKRILLYTICLLIGFIYAGKDLIYGLKALEPIDVCSYQKKLDVIKKGDIEAYKFIVDSIRNDGMSPKGNNFYYSLVMSIAYEYPPANYDVYTALRYTFGDIDKMDKDTREMAIHFLKKGAKANDINCRNTLSKYQTFTNKSNY